MYHRRHAAQPAPLVWEDRSSQHGKAFSAKRVCLFLVSLLLVGACVAIACVEVAQEVAQIVFHYATANPAHTSAEVPQKFMQLGDVTEDMPDHFFPMKGGNERKSGFVPWVAPWNISQPSWGFEQDKPMASAQIYNPPLIDSDRNIYIAVRSNRLYSLAPDGALRWSMMAGKIPNWTIQLMPKISAPVLAGRYIYIADGSAYLLKIHKDTGEVKWRMRYTWQDEGDNHLKGLTYHKGTLLVHGWCSEMLKPLCTFTITALDAIDGHVLWKILDPGETPADPRQVIFEDFVVMLFDKTEVRCWDLRTGERKWSLFVITEEREDWEAKSGYISASLDGVLYASADDQEKRKDGSIVQDYKIDNSIFVAIDIRTGRRLWERKFPGQMYASRSAVYTIGGRTLVSVQLGWHAPAMWEGQTVAEWSDYYRQKFNIRKNHVYREGDVKLTGSVLALDARTGEVVWNFTLGGAKEPWPAGSNLRLGVCWCAHWSDPAVGLDGTLYIGRMDGMLYALNGATGELRSSYDMGSGMVSSPAVAPGMLVVSACAWTAVFKQDPNARVAPGRVRRPWSGSIQLRRVGRPWDKFYRTPWADFPNPSVRLFKEEMYNGSVRDGVLVEGAGTDWLNGFYIRRPFHQVQGRQTFYMEAARPAKIFWNGNGSKWCIADGFDKSANSYYCSSAFLPP